MPAPIDYASPLLQSAANFNPAQAFGQGQQIGQGLLDARAQGQQQAQQDTLFAQQQQDRTTALEMARKKVIADAQAKQQLLDDRRFVAENPTVANVQAYMAKHPEESEASKRLLDSLAPAEKQQKFDLMARTLSAIDEDRPDIAEQAIRETAEAYRKTRPDEAKALDRMADRARDNPKILRGELMKGLLSIDDKFFEGYKGGQLLEADRRAALAKAEQDELKAEVEKATALDAAIAKLNLDEAQAQRFKDQTAYEAKRLGFDYYKLAQDTANARAALGASERKLTPAQEKELNDVSRSGVLAANSAEAAEALADKFDEASKTFTLKGGVAKVDEWLKEALGNTDEMSAIRRQFASIANQEVLKNLPPGAASDRDVNLMREGLPEKTDDPKRISEFLRAQARVTRAVQQMKTTEAEYINQNGSLGPAKTDLVIDGKVVPKGMRFDQVLAAKSIKPAEKKAETSAADAFFGVQ
jgi:hypothetical protein